MSEKKLSRRDFLKAASTALAASGLAALPVGVVGAQDEEVNLVLWGFASNRVEWMQNVVDELWSDMHPNVGFTFEQTPYWDLWPKLTAAFVGGAGIPDMVDIEINQTGQYVREPGNEPFAAMNDLLGDDLDDLSIPSATAPWTVRGNIYGVGNEVNPLLMLYRVDVMEELGVDAEAPVSWEEWIEQVGGPVQDSGTALTTFDRGAGSWRELNNVLNAAGGQFFDGDGNVTVLDDDLAVDILNWQKGHVDSGLFLVSDADWWGLLGDSALVSMYGAPWLQGFMKQNIPDMEGQWRMRHIPKWSPDSPKTSPYGGTGMGITAASENKQESYEFIRVCNITAEGSLLAFRRMNLFPSYTPVWDSEELLRPDDYFGGQVPGQYIAEAAAEMAVVNVDPYWGLFGDIVNRLVMDPVFEADADPRAALEEAIEEFEFSK